MNFELFIREKIERLRREGLHRTLNVSEGLSFVHNDYLGISQHPRLLEAGEWALRVQGAGSRGSRLLGGHSTLIADTEEKIAQFFGSPAALFFSTGYLANLAAVQTLAEAADTIISDEKNHASLIDGVRLSQKPKWIAPHQRWDLIPEELRKQKLLLISESLFSMDGDFANLSLLGEITDALDCFLLLDEAHAAGVFWEQGRGLSSERPRDWGKMAVIVTFGKAFGVAGAAILCSASLKELLISSARSFIYTTAPAPVVTAMVGASLDVVAEEGWRRTEIWQRAEKVREILSEANKGAEIPVKLRGSVWEQRCPIIPFLIPSEDRALRFCENMRKSGVELRAIRYPTVPKGSERIRISLNLLVSRENTESMAKEVVRQWTEFS